MSVISKDLWPRIDFNFEVETPAGLLKFQADLLSDKTGGILRGELSSFTERNILFTTFWIIAPRLDHYRYALIKTVSGATLYPVYVYDYSISESPSGPNSYPGVEVKFPGIIESLERASFAVYSQAEFERAVKEILSSPETATIIHSLMSQSRALSATL